MSGTLHRHRHSQLRDDLVVSDTRFSWSFCFNRVVVSGSGHHLNLASHDQIDFQQIDFKMTKRQNSMCI